MSFFYLQTSYTGTAEMYTPTRIVQQVDVIMVLMDCAFKTIGGFCNSQVTPTTNISQDIPTMMRSKVARCDISI